MADTKDLVEHLRSVASRARDEVEDIDYAEHATLTEAADEIERLRAELSKRPIIRLPGEIREAEDW